MFQSSPAHVGRALVCLVNQLYFQIVSILARPRRTGAHTPQKGISFQHLNPCFLRTAKHIPRTRDNLLCNIPFLVIISNIAKTPDFLCPHLVRIFTQQVFLHQKRQFGLFRIVQHGVP